MSRQPKTPDIANADMRPHPDAPVPGGFSRRGFMGVALGGSALAGLQAHGQTPVASALQALDQVSPQFFQTDEWQQIIALCDALIPADGDGPGATEARVAVFIDRQLAGDWGTAALWYMEGPFDPAADPLLGFQSPLPPARIYREGLAWFDDWCQRTHNVAFLTLDPDRRHKAVTALMEKEVDFPPEIRDFPTFLLQNTKEGYLADPRHGGNQGMVAWSYIGFPGARASFLPWTDPARDNKAYPLGPVSIKGERA